MAKKTKNNKDQSSKKAKNNALLAQILSQSSATGLNLSKAQQKAVLNALEGRAFSAQNQFLLGLVLGALATWVLSDEALRGKLLRKGMQLYAQVLGGVEEIKEQVADIQAEMAQED